MTTAFCPGHITCFFSPMRTDDILNTGSVGVGIKLSKGSYVTLEERSDKKIVFTMDGRKDDCWISESAIKDISDRGFDVTIENELPSGQGLGMSAASCIASALCAAEFEGRTLNDAFRASHIAEIRGGGGLGDVAGIMCNSHVPVRKKAGFPPNGVILDSKLKFDNITLAVFSGSLSTGDILSDEEINRRLMTKGSECVEKFLAESTRSNLYSLSRSFSSYLGLETHDMSRTIDALPNAAMCMLGHTIFTDVSEDVVSDNVHDAEIITCSSTDIMPFICKE